MKIGSFLSLLRQDLAIVLRNGYLYVVLVMALLFILLINFAIPHQLNLNRNIIYMVDNTEGQLIKPEIQSIGLEVYLLNSEEELRLTMNKNKSTYGIAFQGDTNNPRATIYHQGDENEKYINNLKATVSSLWSRTNKLGHSVTHIQKMLRPASEKPPFNLILVPLLLALEVTLMGSYFVVALIFQEKAEGSIRAYRISPAGTWPYIMSKTTVNVLLSLLYGFLLFVFTLGLHKALLPVLLLVGLVSFLITVFGLTFSVFFNSLSECIFVMMVIAAIIALPLISYFIPSFGISILPFIPTYPLMFGIRELIFPTGKTGFFLPLLSILATETLLMLILARFVVGWKLIKEVHK